jgi:hypothetical protein
MQRSLANRVAAARWKVADSESLDRLVDEFLLGLGHQIAHGIAQATHAHLKTVDHKDHGGTHEVEIQVVARAADQIHTFRVDLTVDNLNTIGILDYTSMGAGGEKGRNFSKSFDLPAHSTPGHFVQQLVGAALEQYQGKRAPVDVRMMSAAWKVKRYETK